jgi:hypothetical protein
MKKLAPFLSIVLVVVLSCDSNTPAAPETTQTAGALQAKQTGPPPGPPPGPKVGLAGYEIVSYDWFINTLELEDTWILECPGGKKALGAGYDKISGPDWVLREMYPAQLAGGGFAFLWTAGNSSTTLSLTYRIFVTCAS